MALIMIPPRIRFVDDNGDPLDGGKVYTDEAGTSTPKTTWSDEAETTPNANPVILDGRGEAVIRLNGSYKIDVHDKNDNPLSGYPVDNITQFDMCDLSGLTATIADLNSTTTTAINKNLDYSIILTDRGKTVLADSSAAKVTVTLLPAATATNRYRITIKKVNISDSTKPVEILGSGTETIDGVNSLNLYDINDYVEVLCDGSNWRIVSGQIRGTTLPITAVTTITFDDHSKTYLADASGGAFDFNLLPSSTVGAGFQIRIKKTDSSSNAITIKPNGSETIDGAADFSLTEQYDFIYLINDGNNWFAIGEYGSEQDNALPKGYIDGLQTSRDSGDVQHDILIQTGETRDTPDNINMKLGSNLIKRIDANWVAGTGNGGFPSGLTLTANTWYHIFVIGKTDGTVDAGFDSDITASNLLADATGYTGYRRIGSIRTDASLNITNYYQDTFNLDIFYWNSVVVDVNVTDPGAAPVTVALTVPPDITVYAMLSTLYKSGIANPFEVLAIYPTFITPTTNPTITVSPNDAWSGNQCHILTDTSRQIIYDMSVSTATTGVEIRTSGWIDARGKE